MREFERPPAPSEETPRHEQADRVLDGFVAGLKSWRGWALGAALGLGVHAVDRLSESSSPQTPEAEPTLGADIRFGELRALDPEASPERLRLIFGTLPEGLLEGVRTIQFRDEKKEISAEYGQALHVHSEAAATASGGEGASKGEIVFWRGMKGASSKEIWGDTFEHELFHLRDWRTASGITEEMRESWKGAVYERVQAEDRYFSPYVETITNKDPFLQLDYKAVEYWAETGAAYVAGKPLPPKDAALHARINAVFSPGFDRDAALGARRIFLQEMASDEASEDYQTLPAEERASIEAWMEWRVQVETQPGDLAMRREGRTALLDAFERLSHDPAAQRYLMALADYYHARQELFEAKSSEHDPLSKDTDTVAEAQSELVEAFLDLKAEEELFREAGSVRREVDDILNRYRIWIGGGDTAMRTDPGEEDAWTEKQTRFVEILPLFRPPQEDIVERYLGLKSFIPLAE